MTGKGFQVTPDHHCITVLFIGSIVKAVHLSVAQPLLWDAAATTRTLELPVRTNSLLAVFALVRSIGAVRIIVALPAVRDTLGSVQTLELIRLAVARTIDLVRTQTGDGPIQTVVFVVTSPVLRNAVPVVAQELIRWTRRRDRHRTVLFVAVIPTVVLPVANPRSHVARCSVWTLQELARMHRTTVSDLRTTDLIRGIRTVRIVVAAHLVGYAQPVVATELGLRITRAVQLITSISTVLDIVTVLRLWNTPPISAQEESLRTLPAVAETRHLIRSVDAVRDLVTCQVKWNAPTDRTAERIRRTVRRLTRNTSPSILR